MEDEEFILKTLSNIVSTQAEIERSQRGIQGAIEILQKRIKNNRSLEAWEQFQAKEEVRQRKHRIQKYGTDEPSFSQLYGGCRVETIGYNEEGAVRVDIPYYTCICSQVGTKNHAQRHDSGCPFYIMVDQPKRGWMTPDEIATMLSKENNGKQNS